MYTFVIDIHGGLAELETATPFLYPIQDLMQIVPLIENKFSHIPAAAEHVRKVLERNVFNQWQAIFLVDLGLQHPNPLVGSLTYYLLTIKEKFLAPLKQVNLLPQNILVIAIDPLERGQRGTPLDPNFATRWELDAHGIHQHVNGENFTFHMAEVKSIDALWEKNLDIRKEQFGRGLDGLSKELQENLMQRCAKLEHAVQQLITNKKANLDAAPFQDAPINVLLQQSWQNIYQQFQESLRHFVQHIDSPVLIEDFQPSQILARVIQNNFSIHAEYFRKDVTVIRFPFPPVLPLDFQRRILQLAFLLVVLAQNDMRPRLSPYQNYTVTLYSRDDPSFAQLLADYRKCLQINGEELRQQITNPSERTLTFHRYNTQKCSERISEQKSPTVTFPFFLDNDAPHHLTDWIARVDETVHTIDHSRQEKIDTCIEFAFRQKTEESTEDIAHLSSKTHLLHQEYIAQLNRLPQDDSQPVEDAALEKLLRQNEQEIRAVLSHRPTRNQFLIVSVASFLLLFLFMLYHAHHFLYWSGWGVLFIGLTALAGVWCRSYFALKLERLVKTVTNYADTLILNIQNAFERQKEFLLKLFNVNIARQNYLKTQAVAKEQEKEKLRLNYYIKQLENHLLKAIKLCELYPLPQNSYEGLIRRDFFDLDPTLPVVQNKILSPVSFRKVFSVYSYKLGVDDGYSACTSPYLPDLDRIDFNKDTVYPGGY